jgi:hypothetical protein
MRHVNYNGGLGIWLYLGLWPPKSENSANFLTGFAYFAALANSFWPPAEAGLVF